MRPWPATDDPNAPIWRFLEFWKFRDLMKGHMYFHRSDLSAEPRSTKTAMVKRRLATLPSHPRQVASGVITMLWND